LTTPSQHALIIPDNTLTTPCPPSYNFHRLQSDVRRLNGTDIDVLVNFDMQNVPREIDVEHLVRTDRLGAGEFGEVK